MIPNLDILPPAQLKLWPQLSMVPKQFVLYSGTATSHGYKLTDGLACAKAIYGLQFDPATTLRALCSYREGDLPELSHKIRKRLTDEALAVNNIPVVKAISPVI